MSTRISFLATQKNHTTSVPGVSQTAMAYFNSALCMVYILFANFAQNNQKTQNFYVRYHIITVQLRYW